MYSCTSEFGRAPSRASDSCTARSVVGEATRPGENDHSQKEEMVYDDGGRARMATTDEGAEEIAPKHTVGTNSRRAKRRRRPRMRWIRKLVRRVIKEEENRKQRKDRYRQGEVSKRGGFDNHCKDSKQLMSDERSAWKTIGSESAQFILRGEELRGEEVLRTARNGSGRLRGNSVRGIQYPRCADRYAFSCRGEVWNCHISHSLICNSVLIYMTHCIDEVCAHIRTHSSRHMSMNASVCINRYNCHKAIDYQHADSQAFIRSHLCRSCVHCVMHSFEHVVLHKRLICVERMSG